MERETEEATLSPEQLHQLAETHLRMRNFSLARQYLLEVQSSLHRRSFNRSATQLLAIADVLCAATSPPPVNHYSVLQLDSFTNDHNIIRAHLKKLIFILDPIRATSPLAQEALTHVKESYDFLSDPSKKDPFDAELRKTLIHGGGGNVGGFWTFCPYCFYLYEYEKAYQGCCLRCQNVGCRRAFEGVGIASLPRMELDKGQYFGCYGYFPMGFSPGKDGEKEMGKFGFWSPIVGMFPVKRMKARAGRMDMNGGDDDDGGGGGETGGDCGNGLGYTNGVYDNGTNFIEILDESEAEVPLSGGAADAKGENFQDNVPTGVPIGVKPRATRRKSVAWNARKLMKRRSNEGVGVGDGCSHNADSDEDDYMDEDVGLEQDQNVGAGGHAGDGTEGDMSFFEEDGEIFVGLPDDDAP